MNRHVIEAIKAGQHTVMAPVFGPLYAYAQYTEHATTESYGFRIIDITGVVGNELWISRYEEGVWLRAEELLELGHALRCAAYAQIERISREQLRTLSAATPNEEQARKPGIVPADGRPFDPEKTSGGCGSLARLAGQGEAQAGEIARASVKTHPSDQPRGLSK